ncbi:MAG: DUF3096 domain-containing protein [Patescibacteria group bacterium]
MEKLEIIFKFMRSIAWAFIFEGIATILLGILIFVYPDLLAILVAAVLITTGIISFIVAFKAYSYSKFEIKL